MSRVFTEEFKHEAIRLKERSGRTYAQLSSDLGINGWTLRSWCQGRGMGKPSRKPASTKAAAAPVCDETLQEKVARLERENALLRKENETLHMDRAILKKAAAFFAKESE